MLCRKIWAVFTIPAIGEDCPATSGAFTVDAMEAGTLAAMAIVAIINTDRFFIVNATSRMLLPPLLNGDHLRTQT